jgi:hypothetical protein
MKREHRKLSSAEWHQITSRGPMVRRIPPPEHSHTSHTPETGAKLKVTVYYAPPRASL